MRKTQLNEDQQKFALEQRTHLTTSEIARQLGTSRAQIERFLHASGYPARKTILWTPYLKEKFCQLYAAGGYRAVKDNYEFEHMDKGYIKAKAKKLGVSAPGFEKKPRISEKNKERMRQLYVAGGMAGVLADPMFADTPDWLVKEIALETDAQRYNRVLKRRKKKDI